MKASLADPRVQPHYLVHMKAPKGSEAFYPETSESDYTREGAMKIVRSDPADVDYVVMLDMADGICRDVTEDLAREIEQQVHREGGCSLPLANFLMDVLGFGYRDREVLRGVGEAELRALDRASAIDHRRESAA